jgi:NAD(P)-dependent dehydrogenase (short-subunit alcohol dehydrogenase family)
MTRPPVALVFGARNSGAAIAAERIAAGWRALLVARTEETLALARERVPDARTMAGDAADPATVERAVGTCLNGLGGLDLVVNAVAAAPRGQPFGGGPIAEAPADRLDDWMAAVVPMAFAILRGGGRALAAQGGGTLVQISGGSARRGMPGRGPWAAAQFALRGMVQALAQEMRPRGVHVALLVVDGGIETDRSPAGRAAEDSASTADVAAAVAYLADQSPRGWTHELVITPRNDTWVP